MLILFTLLPLLVLTASGSSSNGTTPLVELENKHIILWLCGFDKSWLSFLMHDLLHPQAFAHYSLSDYVSYLQKKNITPFTKPAENAAVYPLFEAPETAIAKHHQPRMIVYNIENCGSDAKYTIVIQYVTMFNSSVEVLMHLSDEFMASPRKYKYGEGIEVYKLARRLVLREYGVWPYRGSLDNATLARVVQLPLEYHPDMVSRYNRSLVDIILEIRDSDTYRSANKVYNWSFVGTTHHHKIRKECVDTFKAWSGYNLSEGTVDWANMHKQNVHPAEMFEIYKRSRFVVNGRGAVNLDCSRIYEAMLSGSIPVVIGELWEVQAEFDFNGDRPNFVHAATAVGALVACQGMDHDEVDRRRVELINWYIRKIRGIRALVMAAME